MFNLEGINVRLKTTDEMINEVKTVLNKYGIEDKLVSKVRMSCNIGLINLSKPEKLSLALLATKEYIYLDTYLKELKKEGRLNEESLKFVCNQYFQYLN